MKWKKFTLKTLSEVEDIVISTLAEAGVEGVEIEDKVPLTESDKQQMFVDILPEGPKDDGIAYLNFYVEEDTDETELLERVKAELDDLRNFMDIGECTITASETEDKDWINNWKQYFHQFYVDDILIIPSWEQVKPEDESKMIIHIDPGTAFGTGMHETTQLCMRQLKKYVTSETELLDVCAALADYNAGTGAVNVDLNLRVVSFDLDLGNTSGVQLVLQILSDVVVFNNQIANLIFTGVPTRVPVFDYADAQSMGINFLTHSNLLLKPSRSHRW